MSRIKLKQINNVSLFNVQNSDILQYNSSTNSSVVLASQYASLTIDNDGTGWNIK